jgi:hypothetical protein
MNESSACSSDAFIGYNSTNVSIALQFEFDHGLDSVIEAEFFSCFTVGGIGNMGKAEDHMFCVPIRHVDRANHVLDRFYLRELVPSGDFRFQNRWGDMIARVMRGFVWKRAGSGVGLSWGMADFRSSGLEVWPSLAETHFRSPGPKTL